MPRLRQIRVLAALFVVLMPGTLRAEPDTAALARVLRLDELAQALHEEGIAHGRSLDRDMLDGRGGDHWQIEVARIYDAGRIARAVEEALTAGLSGADTAACIAFFSGPLGQEILSLEIAARVAMRDAQVEAAARALYEDLKGGDDPRLAAVARFVAVNDLVDRNVAGALTASYQFFRGMVDGDVLDLGEADILSRVWAEEGDTRIETEAWLYGYLLMAYRPLSARDLDRYVAFSDSAAGRALNAALFAGFDAVYRDISYDLGLRIAGVLKASDL